LVSLTPTQLVELKNGVTFNGHLVECDNFMNVTLREVYQTSADGDRFWKMKEMFIKGNMVSRSDGAIAKSVGWWAVGIGVVGVGRWALAIPHVYRCQRRAERTAVVLSETASDSH
jgi:hypothetical protein